MIKAVTFIAQGGFALGIFTPEQQQIIGLIIDDILSISLTFALVSVSIFFPSVFRGIHKKIAAARVKTEWETLYIVSQHAVRSAEFNFHSGDGSVKFDYAADFIEDFAKKNGISFVTNTTTRILVESALYEMRQNKKPEA
jgi:hypothetical protein